MQEIINAGGSKLKFARLPTRDTVPPRIPPRARSPGDERHGETGPAHGGPGGRVDGSQT